MSDTLIRCPSCEATIPVSKALEAQIRRGLEAELNRRWQDRLQEAVEQAEQRGKAQLELEIRSLRDQLESQRQKTEEAQRLELELRKEKAELEQRAQEMELEIQRRLDEERRRMEAALRERLEQEQYLKLLEKDKQIEDLRQALEEAKRRSELGSQELQGEVLELDIQARLEQAFPHDAIEPVPKGMRGADIVHRVRNTRFEECGAIVWEVKNTKHWQPAWIDKLKEDQRALGAPLAAIVSVTLPEDIRGFGRIDGVWVSDLKCWPALAAVLREQLIQVSFARAASRDQETKMAFLYRYLSSDAFRQRVETIVEAWKAMQEQLQKEKNAMMKHWAQREKQLQRVIQSTASMYGEIQGIIGSALQPVPALELDAGLLEHKEE